MSTTGTPGYAPRYTLHRKVAAADAGAPSVKEEGFNAAEFREMSLFLALLGGATAATITVWYWSEEAAAFVKASPNVTFALVANAKVIIPVDHHDSVFVTVDSITGGAAGDKVKVSVGGMPVFDRRG